MKILLIIIIVICVAWLVAILTNERKPKLFISDFGNNWYTRSEDIDTVKIRDGYIIVKTIKEVTPKNVLYQEYVQHSEEQTKKIKP